MPIRWLVLWACLALAWTASSVESLSLLTYNVNGNGVTDWSTNSPQVRAIGREVSYLNPDLLTFQEIPANLTWQMTNFVRAFLPGYALATNSGTDGYIRSVILSRFPITRSQSWLDRANLAAFGYNGPFTRDLFEAEISVPAFEKPLHVFTTHLKSGSDSTSQTRRVAEARAISNFLVTVFQPASGSHPYLLSGDLNEDADFPYVSGSPTFSTLINPATGLRSTKPVNPVTGSALTWSTRAANFTIRFDYVLPGGLLFSNILSSQVFRTETVTNLLPPLLVHDSTNASDHAPVLMTFGSPYNTPFHLSSWGVSNQMVTLQWESAPGRQYHLEASSNLSSGGWTWLATNLTAAGTVTTFLTNLSVWPAFFRVYRVP